MAKNRMINTKFWSDTFISNLDSLEKLLFLYLITNQYTNICGIYELPIKQIALDTGIDKDNLEKTIFPRLEKAKKVYYINGWVYLRNFLKHQKATGNVQLGIENGRGEVPAEILAKIEKIEKQKGTKGGQRVVSGGQSLKLKLESELEFESESKLKKEKIRKEKLKSLAKVKQELIKNHVIR